MLAFEAGLKHGFACSELDVSRTKDGILVALHARELQLEFGQGPNAQVHSLSAGCAWLRFCRLWNNQYRTRSLASLQTSPM